MEADSPREKIEAICRSTRSIFEQVLRSALVNRGAAGGELVRGTCLFACLLLKESLERFADCTVDICGGDGQEDGWVFDTAGAKRGHYWTEGVTPGGARFLADITADQFGHEPIVLLWREDSWETYQPGDAARVSSHVKELGEELRLGSG